MAAVNPCQVLCGPFAKGELPDFQAACVHFDQQWTRFLSLTEAEFIKAVMYRTARMGIRHRQRRIPMAWFFDGHLGNEETGYAGCPSMVPVSRNTFHKVRNALVSYGILEFNGDDYAIDYSVTALHLAQNLDVQKRVLSQNRHGGLLSTVEGIIAWAKHCISLLLGRTNTENPAQNPSPVLVEPNSSGSVTSLNGKPATNLVSLTDARSQRNTNTRGAQNGSTNTPVGPVSTSRFPSELSPYRVTHNTYVTFSDKSSKDTGAEVSAKDLLNRLTAEVEAKRQTTSANQRKRRTLADLCNLFEKAWQRGQKERDGSMLPARLGMRDRALLKSQIIGPARDLDMDVEAFGYFVSLHWDAIGATYFKKSKAYPERPAFAWFVRCLETYTEAFTARDSLDPTAKPGSRQRVTSAAVTALADQSDKALAAAASQIEYLEARLREAEDGAAIDDSFNTKKLRRATHIPSFDDPQPRRVKLKRPSK